MFQMTNWRNLTLEDLDMVKKRETLTEKLILFKQQNKTMLCKPTSLMSRVFANGPGDRGSIPGRVIPQT